MKEKMLKKDIVIKDKITGKMFLVGDVEEDAFWVSLLNDDGTEVIPNLGSRVEKKDLIMYRFVKDLQEAKLPSIENYDIMNGKLVWKDGHPVTEQGEFVFSKIIGAIKSCLLLMTENWEVVLYNLRKDMFKTLVFNPISNEMFKNKREFKYEVVQASSPFLAYCNIWKIGDAIGEKIYRETIVLAENKEGVIVVRVLTDGEVKKAFTTDGILVLSYITPDGGEASSVYIDGAPTGKVLYFAGTIVRAQSINGYKTAQIENGDIDVTAPDGRYYIFRTSGLNGFSAFDEDGEGVYFVNRDRKVKKVVTTNTRDRGTVYSVKDIN